MPSLPFWHKAEDEALVPSKRVFYQLPRFRKQAYPPCCLRTAKITWSPQIGNISRQLSNLQHRALSKLNRIYAYTSCVNSCFRWKTKAKREQNSMPHPGSHKPRCDACLWTSIHCWIPSPSLCLHNYFVLLALRHVKLSLSGKDFIPSCHLNSVWKK